MIDLPELPPQAFRKQDQTPDEAFYVPVRLVTHIDDTAIDALTDFYRERLPAGGRLLDLMSSWVSHYPPEVAYANVVGHGMNAQELAANPRLDRWFVQNLNTDDRLPLDDDSFDAVTICVSVQYLERPVSVLREVARVLRPAGKVIVCFSNRCFSTKAVAIWQALDRDGQTKLVQMYLDRAGFAPTGATTLVVGSLSDPLTAVTGWAA